jgi:hypothetical protein
VLVERPFRKASLRDYKKAVYQKVRRPLRPLDDITWEDVERHQTFG